MAEPFAMPAEEQHNNDLFERFPFLADSLLPLCDAGDMLAVSATCQSWRRAVQLGQLSLAPRSELAMPFVAGCLHLRHLQLSHMLPAASHGPNSSSLLAHVAHLVRLTQLDLACSQTRAWRGQAVQVTAEDLGYLIGCTALQVLDLSHQPCLKHPASLAPLAGLCCLTALRLSISDTSWIPPADAWQALAALTGLQYLDLSGWSRCRVTPAAAAAATGGQPPGEEGASPNCSCVCQQTAAGPAWQLQQQQGRSRRSSDSSSSSSSGGSASSSSGGAGSSRIGRALGRLLHGRAHAPAFGRCTCSAAVTPVAGLLTSTPAAGTLPGCEAARIGATHSAKCAAPLQLLSSLTRLQQLLLADWAEPPCLAGLFASQHLPHLTSLDISRCMNQQLQAPSSSAASSSQQVSLLALLTGTTKQQQQQLATAVWPAGTTDSAAHAQPAAAAAASTGPAPPAARATAVGAAALSAPLFDGLLCLKCSGIQFVFEPVVWAGLSHLRHLDVSACPRFKAEGCGSHLKELQQLVASDCVQLDHDALTDLLASAQQLQHLDLQRSVVILHGSGRTAAALSSGRYSRPVLQHKHRQQAVGPTSRRDVADFSGAEQAVSSAVPPTSLAPAAAAASPASPAAAAAAGSGPDQGLQVLLMSECQLAFEAFVWQDGAGNPDHPSLLLFDLVSSAAKGLHNLHSLHWSRADSTLAAVILSQLVPLASRALTALHLSSCSLPEDPSRCWQGLAAATNLRVLDLNHTGFSRQGYANPCGTNPTVALLTAVARMRLRVLWLAGWRFFFADFKPLAGLAGCLESLDLTRARDVDDRTLWSLTNLTSLTSLSVSGARVSSDQIFSLIFLHLSCLKDLDLSSVSTFTSHSLPALLQLPSLTSLDIRLTPATADAAAVALLVKLPNCRRLALSVAGDTTLQRQEQQQSGQALSEVYSRGTPRSSFDGVDGRQEAHEGLQAYAYLGQLRQAQSLRQLLLGGSTPSLTEYVRGLLPPWVDVR